MRTIALDTHSINLMVELLLPVQAALLEFSALLPCCRGGAQSGHAGDCGQREGDLLPKVVKFTKQDCHSIVFLVGIELVIFIMPGLVHNALLA